MAGAMAAFRQKVFNGNPPPQEGVPPTAATADTPPDDERELVSLREQLQASLAENERLRAELAELRPTADPDAFVAATNAMGFNDADRQPSVVQPVVRQLAPEAAAPVAELQRDGWVVWKWANGHTRVTGFCYKDQKLGLGLSRRVYRLPPVGGGEEGGSTYTPTGEDEAEAKEQVKQWLLEHTAAQETLAQSQTEAAKRHQAAVVAEKRAADVQAIACKAEADQRAFLERRRNWRPDTNSFAPPPLIQKGDLYQWRTWKTAEARGGRGFLWRLGPGELGVNEYWAPPMGGFEAQTWTEVNAGTSAEQEALAHAVKWQKESVLIESPRASPEQQRVSPKPQRASRKRKRAASEMPLTDADRGCIDQLRHSLTICIDQTPQDAFLDVERVCHKLTEYLKGTKTISSYSSWPRLQLAENQQTKRPRSDIAWDRQHELYGTILVDGVRKLIEIAKRHGMMLIDLGSGAGNVIAAAHRCGVKVHGCELSPRYFKMQKMLFASLGVEDTPGVHADMFDYMPPETDQPLLVFINNYHLTKMSALMVERLRDFFPIGTKIVTILPLMTRQNRTSKAGSTGRVLVVGKTAPAATLCSWDGLEVGDQVPLAHSTRTKYPFCTYVVQQTDKAQEAEEAPSAAPAAQSVGEDASNDDDDCDSARRTPASVEEGASNDDDDCTPASVEGGASNDDDDWDSDPGSSGAKSKSGSKSGVSRPTQAMYKSFVAKRTPRAARLDIAKAIVHSSHVPVWRNDKDPSAKRKKKKKKKKKKNKNKNKNKITVQTETTKPTPKTKGKRENGVHTLVKRIDMKRNNRQNSELRKLTDPMHLQGVHGPRGRPSARSARSSRGSKVDKVKDPRLTADVYGLDASCSAFAATIADFYADWNEGVVKSTGEQMMDADKLIGLQTIRDGLVGIFEQIPDQAKPSNDNRMSNAKYGYLNCRMRMLKSTMAKVLEREDWLEMAAFFVQADTNVTNDKPPLRIDALLPKKQTNEGANSHTNDRLGALCALLAKCLAGTCSPSDVKRRDSELHSQAEFSDQEENDANAGGEEGFARSIVYGLQQMLQRVEGLCDRVVVVDQRDIDAYSEEINQVFVRLRHKRRVSERQLTDMLHFIDKMKHRALLGPENRLWPCRPAVAAGASEFSGKMTTFFTPEDTTFKGAGVEVAMDGKDSVISTIFSDPGYLEVLVEQNDLIKDFGGGNTLLIQGFGDALKLDPTAVCDAVEQAVPGAIVDRQKTEELGCLAVDSHDGDGQEPGAMVVFQTTTYADLAFSTLQTKQESTNNPSRSHSSGLQASKLKTWTWRLGADALGGRIKRKKNTIVVTTPEHPRLTNSLVTAFPVGIYEGDDVGPAFCHFTTATASSMERLKTTGIKHGDTVYRIFFLGMGDGAFRRGALKVGSAASSCPLDDSVADRHACSMLHPAAQLREGVSQVRGGRLEKIGSGLAAGMASVLHAHADSRQALARMMACGATQAQLNNTDAEDKDTVVNILGENLSVEDESVHRDRPTQLLYLRDFRKYLFARRYGGQYRRSELTAVDMEDESVVQEFLRDIRHEFETVRIKYALDLSMGDAAIRCATMMETALQHMADAVEQEPEEVQRVVYDENLEISWVQRGNLHKYPVAKAVSLFGAWIEVLKGSADKELTDEQVQGILSAKICTQDTRRSFIALVGGVTGKPFFDECLPGVLHLLLRTVEKVVSLDAVHKHVLTNDDCVAINAAAAAGVSLRYSTDPYSLVETMTSNLDGGTAGGPIQKLCLKAPVLAAPYKVLGKLGLAKLVEAAYSFPLFIYRIVSDPQAPKAFGKSIEELRRLVSNLGAAGRLVLATLYDDRLLHVPSVAQLLVTVPEHFRRGKKLWLALEQQLEAMVQELKKNAPHITNNMKFRKTTLVEQEMELMWSRLRHDGQDAKYILSHERTVDKRMLEYKNPDGAFKRTQVLLEQFMLAARLQTANDVVALVPAVERARKREMASTKAMKDAKKLSKSAKAEAKQKAQAALTEALLALADGSMVEAKYINDADSHSNRWFVCSMKRLGPASKAGRSDTSHRHRHIVWPFEDESSAYSVPISNYVDDGRLRLPKTESVDIGADDPFASDAFDFGDELKYSAESVLQDVVGWDNDEVTEPWDIWSREEDNFVKVENPYPDVWAQPADQQQSDQCDQVDLLRLNELQGVAKEEKSRVHAHPQFEQWMETALCQQSLAQTLATTPMTARREKRYNAASHLRPHGPKLEYNAAAPADNDEHQLGADFDDESFDAESPVQQSDMIDEDIRLAEGFGEPYIKLGSSIVRASIRNICHRASAYIMRPRLVSSDYIAEVGVSQLTVNCYPKVELRWSDDIDHSALKQRTAVIFRCKTSSEMEGKEIYRPGLLIKNEASASELKVEPLEPIRSKRAIEQLWYDHTSFETKGSPVTIDVDAAAAIIPAVVKDHYSKREDDTWQLFSTSSADSNTSVAMWTRQQVVNAAKGHCEWYANLQVQHEIDDFTSELVEAPPTSMLTGCNMRSVLLAARQARRATILADEQHRQADAQRRRQEREQLAATKQDRLRRRRQARRAEQPIELSIVSGRRHPPAKNLSTPAPTPRANSKVTGLSKGKGKGKPWAKHNGWTYRNGSGLVSHWYTAPDGSEFSDEGQALNYMLKKKQPKRNSTGQPKKRQSQRMSTEELQSLDDLDQTASYATRAANDMAHTVEGMETTVKDCTDTGFSVDMDLLKWLETNVRKCVCHGGTDKDTPINGEMNRKGNNNIAAMLGLTDADVVVEAGSGNGMVAFNWGLRGCTVIGVEVLAIRWAVAETWRRILEKRGRQTPISFVCGSVSAELDIDEPVKSAGFKGYPAAPMADIPWKEVTVWYSFDAGRVAPAKYSETFIVLYSSGFPPKGMAVTIDYTICFLPLKPAEPGDSRLACWNVTSYSWDAPRHVPDITMGR